MNIITITLIIVGLYKMLEFGIGSPTTVQKTDEEGNVSERYEVTDSMLLSKYGVWLCWKFEAKQTEIDEHKERLKQKYRREKNSFLESSYKASLAKRLNIYKALGICSYCTIFWFCIPCFIYLKYFHQIEIEMLPIWGLTFLELRILNNYFYE